MICPKCGFEQPDAVECARCGIIISKFKQPGRVPSPAPPSGVPASASPSTFQPAPTGMAPQSPGGPGMAPPRGRVTHGEFRVGAALSTTFSTYAQNLGPFAALTALALLPAIGFNTYIAFAGNPFGDDLALAFVGLAVAVITVFSGQVAAGAVTYGVFQQMRGRHASFGDCLGIGLGVMLPILGVALLSGLAILFGLMACVVPGIVLMVMFYVAIPAMVEERPGVVKALERSVRLTEGYRWHVFAVVATLIGIGWAIDFVLTTAFGSDGSPGGAYLLASSFVNIFTTALGATAAAVVYYQLRSVKESIDVAEIATIFD